MLVNHDRENARYATYNTTNCHLESTLCKNNDGGSCIYILYEFFWTNSHHDNTQTVFGQILVVPAINPQFKLKVEPNTSTL